MFGLFGKSRFPRFKLGPEVGGFEIKIFLSQHKLKLDWKHGDQAFAPFVPWLIESQLYYYIGLARQTRALIDGITSYLDAPGAVWTITEDVRPENYILIHGIWHDNGIGACGGALGGPAGPEADAGRIEALKALIARTGGQAPDPRVAAAIRQGFAWHAELGLGSTLKHRRARNAEAWRLATGG